MWQSRLYHSFVELRPTPFGSAQHILLSDITLMWYLTMLFANPTAAFCEHTCAKREYPSRATVPHLISVIDQQSEELDISEPRLRNLRAEPIPTVICKFPYPPPSLQLSSTMLARTLRSRISRIGALRNDFTTFSREQSTIPYTETCPSPTCPCTVTPAGLDIDRKTPLLHTMAPYSSHVLLCTGKPDWTSRIEDETSPAGHFTRALKERMGKGGKAFDVFTQLSRKRRSRMADGRKI